MPTNALFDRLKGSQESREGIRFLQRIGAQLVGRTIVGVGFINNGEGLTTVLRLDNGQRYAFNDEELFLETLREQFPVSFTRAHRKTRRMGYGRRFRHERL